MNPVLFLGNLSFEVQFYIFFFILFVLLVCCFILIAVIGVKYKKMEKANENEDMEIVKDVLRKLIQKEKDLDKGLKENEDNDKALLKKIEELNELLKKNNENVLILEKKQRKSFDKIKVVRYSVNPEDEKSLDYSIGITNNEGCGVVLTGVKQEDGGTQVVVKTIKNGVSKSPLTDEEKCAIDRITNIS